MSTLTRQSRLVVQPSGPVQIDWSNPITRGLIFAQVGDTQADSVGGSAPISASGAPANMRFGKARAYAGASDQYQIAAADSQPAWGALVLCDVTAIGDFSALLSHTNDLSDGNGWAMGQRGAAFPNMAFVDGTDSGVSMGFTVSSVDGAGPTAIGGGYDGGKYVAYRDGAQTASTTSALTPGTGGPGKIIVGGSHDTPTTGTVIALALVWNRLPGPAEYLALYLNPWQIFKASARRLWVPTAAAAGGGALTGFTATGSAGILVPARSLAAAGTTGTASPGTVLPARSVPITADTGTGSVGTVAAAKTVALSGVSGTSSVGTVTAGGSVTVALTAVSGSATVGNVAPAATQALNGLSAASAPGIVAPQVAPALTATAATGTPGSAVQSRTVPLGSVSATGAPGTVSSSVPGSSALTGTAVVAAPGSVAPGQALSVVGASASASVGQVVRSTTIVLGGVTATSSVGTVSAPTGVVLALTGVTASTQVRSPGLARLNSLSALVATGAVTSMFVGGPTVPGRRADPLVGDGLRRPSGSTLRRSGGPTLRRN